MSRLVSSSSLNKTFLFLLSPLLSPPLPRPLPRRGKNDTTPPPCGLPKQGHGTGRERTPLSPLPNERRNPLMKRNYKIWLLFHMQADLWSILVLTTLWKMNTRFLFKMSFWGGFTYQLRSFYLLPFFLNGWELSLSGGAMRSLFFNHCCSPCRAECLAFNCSSFLELMFAIQKVQDSQWCSSRTALCLWVCLVQGEVPLIYNTWKSMWQYV